MAYLACKELMVGYAGPPVAQDITFGVGAGDALMVVGYLIMNVFGT